MSKQNLLKGTLILTVANLINRLLGLVNQALVLRLMGSEGYGLFQLAIPIYLLLLILTTAGIPIAISKLVAEEHARGNFLKARKVLQWSVLRLGLTGLVVALGLALILPKLGNKVMVDPRAGWCLLVLLPSIPISAVSSALRAYFQGIQNMTIPAAGQIIEQIVRVLTGLYLAARMSPWGIPLAAAGYASGIVFGEACGCLLLTIFYLRENNLSKFRTKYSPSQVPSAEPKSVQKPIQLQDSLFTKIWSIAGPVTFTRLTAVILLNVEAFLIPNQMLLLGYSRSESTAIYGLFTGVALTLISIPSIFTTAISTNLLPAVSAAWVRKDWLWLKDRLSRILGYTVMAGLPVLVILGIFPNEISTLIFKVNGAAIPVRILAMGGIFLYLLQTTNGILLGLGKAKRVLANTFIFALVRISGIYTLTSIGIMLQQGNGAFAQSSIPFLNLLEGQLVNLGLVTIFNNGLGVIALAYIISFVIGAALNFIPLYRRFIAWNLSMNIIIPMMAAAGMGCLMLKIVDQIPKTILVTAPILVQVMVIGLFSYFILLIAGGSIKVGEVRKLLFSSAFRK